MTSTGDDIAHSDRDCRANPVGAVCINAALTTILFGLTLLAGQPLGLCLALAWVGAACGTVTVLRICACGSSPDRPQDHTDHPPRRRPPATVPDL